MNKVEKFKKFLEDNGAYESFVEQTNITDFNFDEYVTGRIEEDSFDLCVSSFTRWDNTNEGVVYWSKLSDKWEGVCNEQD